MDGLMTKEAEQRLSKYGKNVLEQSKKKSPIMLFLNYGRIFLVKNTIIHLINYPCQKFSVLFLNYGRIFSDTQKIFGGFFSFRQNFFLTLNSSIS